ncbi:hypothetical protein FVQ98_00505 [Ottowia sp. GY511]|uniref:Uncharacterized protein n=1 Tax=Ottowia flava TaxID=2675430 RepID=A0ABW4KUZ6_9BURK|nr:hypothetical protein [Ottowia sp. GY511]TXK33398.1 hypothetical protein FVQ98_00505 [Ottowia sp. GY511]
MAPSPFDWNDGPAQFLRACPDLTLKSSDNHTWVLTSSRTAGQLALQLWIHDLGSGGLSARRPAAGEDLAQLPACERQHLWVTVRDDDGEHTHSEVLCDTARLHALLQQWRLPMAPTPKTCRVAPAAARSAAPQPPGPWPAPPHPTDTAALDNLADSDRAAAQAQLQANLERLDVARLAGHWPRDARGRLAAKTTALLGVYGPPVTVNQRQPCLLITSGGVRDMPQWQLRLSMEFRENQRHQWDAAPWLWSDQAHAPAAPRHADEVRALIAEGRISEACALCDVVLADGVLRLAAGLPLSRFAAPRPDWADALHDALTQLAPWRLAGGLARIQTRLAAANRRPPRPGSWARKLFWLPGQRTASRAGLGARLGAHGGPLLEVIDTASNALFPSPDWWDDRADRPG